MGFVFKKKNTCDLYFFEQKRRRNIFHLKIKRNLSNKNRIIFHKFGQ